MIVWLNGRLVDPETASVSVFDHGLTVGDGIFEALKTVRGQPFAATRHLRRLHRSAVGLGVRVPVADDDLRAAMAEVVASIDGTARIRLTVTGGPGPAGSMRGDGPPTVLVTAGPLAELAPSTTVTTVPWTRNEHAPTAGLKTTSYADNVIALAYASERGATEAIFANTAGELCEGTGTNVFVVRNGRVATPPLAAGCLAGITREILLERGDIEQVPIPMAALDDAEEIFVTSTTRDVQAVTDIDGRPVADGEIGPRTLEIASWFADLQEQTTEP